MRDFRKLDVWSKAHELVLAVYAATKTFPRDEAFGLTSQLRRSAASIPANIAEGCGRIGDAELVRFLGIAMGSATELEYQLLLASDLGYLSADDYSSLDSEATRVKKMLASLIRRIRPLLPEPNLQADSQ